MQYGGYALSLATDPTQSTMAAPNDIPTRKPPTATRILAHAEARTITLRAAASHKSAMSRHGVCPLEHDELVGAPPALRRALVVWVDDDLASLSPPSYQQPELERDESVRQVGKGVEVSRARIIGGHVDGLGDGDGDDGESRVRVEKHLR